MTHMMAIASYQTSLMGKTKGTLTVIYVTCMGSRRVWKWSMDALHRKQNYHNLGRNPPIRALQIGGSSRLGFPNQGFTILPQLVIISPNLDPRLGSPQLGMTNQGVTWCWHNCLEHIISFLGRRTIQSCKYIRLEYPYHWQSSWM